MPINNVGLQDRSVYISADASAVKGPFRLNYSLSTSNSELDLFDNTSDSYAEAVRSTNSISTNSAIDISSKNGGTFGFYNNNCTGTE